MVYLKKTLRALAWFTLGSAFGGSVGANLAFRDEIESLRRKVR